MPALVADIAAASRDVVVETWYDRSVALRYPSARDGSAAPADGFFDSHIDAQAVIAGRGALIGVERRRFAVDIADHYWPAVSQGLPSVRVIDAEQAVDTIALVSRIEVNLETETTSLELFGGMSAPDASGGIVSPPAPLGSTLLLDTDGYLLLEDGGHLLLGA